MTTKSIFPCACLNALSIDNKGWRARFSLVNLSSLQKYSNTPLLITATLLSCIGEIPKTLIF